MIVVYVSFANAEEAKKIIQHLLEKKMISCGNIIPSTSYYEWEGKMQENTDVVSFLKTSDQRWEDVKKEITSMHAYDCPMIVKLDAEANENFAKWVDEETK